MADDIFGQIQHFLNTEEGQQQLQDMMGMLGGQNGESPDLSSLLGGLLGGTSSDESADGLPSFSPEMLIGIQQLMGSMHKDDDNTRLLMALKPHFREERQAKVDRAVQFLRLFALWPIIKESGLLGGLFNAK